MGTNITGIGNANAIGFKSRVTGGVYFPPELKDALVGVWSAYGKSNDSTDRNVIKNKIKDRGGDFVIINAAFKLNSGFGKYSADFESFDWAVNISQKQHNKATISLNGRLCNHTAIEVDEMRVNIIGNITELIYWYIANPDDTTRSEIRLTSGINTLPKSYAKDDGQTYNIGFAYISGDSEITIEQIPQFQGAVVTDGVDDLITSTKTLGEMIGDSNDLTVISMIHQISPIQSDTIAYNNYFRGKSNNFVARNRVKNYGKTGIYGYSVSNLSSSSNINTILGDKEDYTTQIVTSSSNKNNVFSVEGFLSVGDGIIAETSQVAWYWTFIAKRVLTEDEINLVIEKYNLDRPGEIVKPDIYYDIKRQKITNENHSSFNNELIDFSGNGHNMKLYNLAWKGGSGIAAKPFETIKDYSIIPDEARQELTIYNEFSYKVKSNTLNQYWTVQSIIRNNTSYQVTIVTDKDCYWVNATSFINSEGNKDNIRREYPVQANTPTQVIVCGLDQFEYPEGIAPTGAVSYVTLKYAGEITVTFIPSYKGGLLLDGVDDYGKVTGLPILKDYTIAADYVRTFTKENAQDSPILSKSKVAGSGAFLFNYLNTDSIISSYSFGTNNILKEINDSERKIYYLSKYASDGYNVNAGSAVDYDSMWLGTYRDNTSNFFTGALYFAMLFPYSLSEFLLERQIKKARAGTLYPSQVEFRPIIPEDENITKIDYFVVNSGTWTVIKPGDYVDVGARIVLNVYTKLPYKVEKVSSPAFTGMSVRHSTELNIFDVEGYIKDKTPQKIKLTLAVNENIVQWNPTITSNLLDSFTASSWYLNGWDNTLTAGTWIKKTDRVFFKATFKTELYGLETATFGGAECIVSKADNWSDSKNIWDIRMLGTVGDLSQVFNLDVYELIRFEDIGQPYPVIFQIKDRNTNQIYSWGDKIKVGSSIQLSQGENPNLLSGLYSIQSYDYEGKTYTYNQLNALDITLTKSGIQLSCNKTWVFDNNEPKCVLSPDRLQIPNSSYRILGHIPDISGHNNHGELNNFAYAGISGANGYVIDFKNWKYRPNNNSQQLLITDSSVSIKSELSDEWIIWNQTDTQKFKIRIIGLPTGGAVRYRYFDTDNVQHDLEFNSNGIWECPANTNAGSFSGFSMIGSKALYVGLTIEQVGEYEGAFCFDGVDDHITIPTLSSGGKQVLMKVNWSKNTFNEILYDQRENLDIHTFAIHNHDSDTVTGEPVVAYESKNNGNTYIDGILNHNVKASELKDIEHNITITNESVNTSNSISPIIGTNKNKDAHYAQMALYDFMLFDNISTEDKIKELNEYIGIEENVFAINPNISIDTPEAVKDIKIYQGGEEISSGYLYLNKDTEFEIYVSLNTGKYSLDTITVDGVEITKDRVVGEYNIFKFTLNGSSEQSITIHSYEYIMYEDIVQPYPSLFTLIDNDTEEVYSWGSKLKIGAKFKGDVVNLLPDMYEWQGDVLYNGEPIYWNTTPGVVAKEMTFSWSKPFKYLKTNAPKCIFSPSKLRMPNESYRYLGYIPDISGNGNNGVFNNFAFSKMSGANGYPYDYKSTSDFTAHARDAVLVNSETVKFINALTQTSFYYKGTSYKGKIKVTGITKAIASGKVRYLDIYSNSPTNNDRVIIDKDGIYDVNIETEDAINIFFYLTPIVSGTTALDEPVYLEQVGNYEGSICFDGVDDSILTSITGGRTVFLKTSVISTNLRILYDQRDVNEQGNLHKQFAIYTSNESEILAYVGRNPLGETYIDGILNKNITCADLIGIKHNITATAPGPVGTEKGVRLGASNLNTSHCKAAIYDFAIFDNVLPSDEIKQFNDIMGIEGDYVQKPDYYWDACGKTNFDIDKDIIQQRGIAKGYNFASFDDELDWYLTPDNGYIDVVSRNGYEITLKNLSTAVYGWYFQNSRVIGFITRDIPFKVKANKSIRVYWDMHFYKISGGENFGHVVSITTLNPNEDTSISLRHLTENELTELDADKSRMYYLLWFDLSTLAIDEEVTIEMLPVEGGKSLALTNNNFAYDKMSGYGGYSFKSFNDSQDTWNILGDGTGVEIISRDGYSMTVKKLVQNLDWQISNNEYRYPTVLNKELPFKCKSNKKVGLVWQLKYKTEGATSDTTVTLINQQLTPNVPLEINLPYKTQDELTELGAVSTSVYYLLYFSNTTLEIGEEYTVEMLPLYPNALLFDGVDDYSKALNIVAPTDYTYIFQRELLGNTTGSASMYSGWFQASGGGAFIADYSINSGGATDGMYGFSFGRNAKVPSLATDKIIYGTTTSVNGTDIIPGPNLATGNSVTLGQWDVNYKKMAFYKLFLYPRTIDMLSINMVKNMMEEGGIIDITSKLFTDKYTGDYDFKDFNNDFFIGD